MKFEFLRDFAADLLAQAEGDPGEAMRLVEKWLEEPGRIPSEIQRDATLYGFQEALDHAMRVGRQRSYDDDGLAVGGESEPGRHKRILPKRPDGARPSIYDYPIRRGKHLGDATKASMSVEADFFDANRIAYAWKARWFASIARALRADDDIVRDHLSERRLMTMRKRAQENAE